MPKKTKKEKIIAAYRKKLQLLQQVKEIQPSKTISIQTESFVPEKKVATVVETKDNRLIISYFFQDLRKSLILIAIVVALEISFYFVRIIK